MFLDYAQDLRKHRMDYEAVVEVQMQVLTVTVPGITLIPVVAESVDTVVETFPVILTGEFQQGGFHGGCEQQPVAFRGLDLPGPLPFVDEPFTGLVVQPAPYLCRSPQDSLCQESGIDKGLPGFSAEGQVVGR